MLGYLNCFSRFKPSTPILHYSDTPLNSMSRQSQRILTTPKGRGFLSPIKRLKTQPFSKMGRDIDGELTCVEKVTMLKGGMGVMYGRKRLPLKVHLFQ